MNKLNSGDLNTLQVGQVLLTKAFKTSTDKIQLEFAEKIAAKDKPVSALTVLNASDDRFSSGAARSWVVATIEDAAKIFNVNFGDDGEWEMDTKANGTPCETITLNILNPEFNNTLFRVRVEETTEPTTSQVKYAEEKSLANYGYHNRIWLNNNTQPNVFAPTAIAAGAAGFDLCQIIASVDGYGGSIGKKGRENIVINYWYDEAAASAQSTLDNALTGIDQEITLGNAYKWEFNGSSVSVG